MSVQSKEIDINLLGGNEGQETFEGEPLKWLSPLKPPFQIVGFPWLAQDGVYRRLPLNPGVPLPSAVDTLAYCTAGGQIRFRTNTSRLVIKVRLAGPANMYHMPATGQCGFDCYLGDPGNQKYVSTTKFNHNDIEYEAQLFRWNTKRDFAVTLNFPLYQGVEEVLIGIDEDAAVSAPPSYSSNRPVVIYGTSVTQGGCASRPGMAYSNILSRTLPVPFVNLGFSGSGKGEPELAQIMADIEDPGLYVLDYEGNTGAAENIAMTLPVFISILRERHPEVPILIVSKIRNDGDRFYEERQELFNRRRLVQFENVEQRRAEGDSHIHFADGFELLGEDSISEITVDGTHLTDLGFLRIAQSLAPIIRPLLNL